MYITGPSQAGGLGGLAPPPVFGQTVNPISARGADHTHHSTTSPPGFSDLATGLIISVLVINDYHMITSSLSWLI